MLLLGTFYNKPTFDGYVELLENIKRNTNIQINVAGFGSERLADLFKDQNIKIWGSVDKDTLKQLIISADYGIIHQQASSGALTRIPELILAGLPLLVNAHAARSNFDVSGLKIYNTYEELTDLLEAQPVMPPVLRRPVAEQLFVNYLKTKIGQA